MEANNRQDNDSEILSLTGNPSSMETGFRILVNTYQERMYWHIRRMVYSHEDADDVLQNAFIKVYRSIGNFKGDSKLYTWLYRIATNEAITFLNKRKKTASSSIDAEDLNLSNYLKADEYFDGNEAEVLLQKALASLPDKQRQVFTLRYYDEMTYKEMSEVLGTSIGALKASYHHAVKKIEDFVKSKS